ncbi:hypothetical protein H9W90_03345 [Polaribacter pectinis]|uniref:DNA topoisomerase IV n=1 Tax=Polaribacter pectinis TaxID=2738844 RepID=A0A7G9LC18_9FLAO|nr:hypothetical protein [Polaribacter pectinis]QNM86167.1 hypothetical protein H9W90_03345 [Polaribacter pectinis]
MKKKEKREKKKEKLARNILVLLLASCFLLLNFTSCQSDIKDNSDRFKVGVFEIPAGDSYSKTIITRKDSLQIEEYEKIVSISNDSTSGVKRIKHIDTLYIKWKNNFFYTLKMKSPKKELDKDPIYVQITNVTEDSYNFTAKIGFSKFATDGTIYKVK